METPSHVVPASIAQDGMDVASTMRRTPTAARSVSATRQLIERADASTRENIMKTRSAPRLLFVAIATSAIVAGIRLNTLPSQDANAAVQQRQSASGHQESRTPTCDADNVHGMLRATCAMHDERRPAEATDTRRATRLWV
jgi:hypothetical protein